MLKKILFLDTFHNLSLLAEKTARLHVPEKVQVASAGLTPERRLYHSEISAGTVALSSLTDTFFDLVVVIGKAAGDKVSLFPGLPPVIRWDDLDQPDDEASFTRIGAVVAARTASLLRDGSFSALCASHTHLQNLIDSLQFGVIAHDLDRKIFLFSKGAERITGTSADKILGKDCHTLFAPRLCGESCAFCDGEHARINEVTSTYEAQFLPSGGTMRRLSVTRMPLVNEQGTMTGALAIFTDTTKLLDLELRLRETESFAGIIGSDDRMLAIYDLIRDLADNDFPVVITGESGTGKELVAAAIHNESTRRDHLFVPVNCGALPEGTLESELFGHLRGSFTGAIRDKKGRFEMAHKGTIFLDEIGDLSLPMQVKLLRVLQEGTIEPVGCESSRKVDVRVICATNRHLKDMVARGQFREDLYYRIAVVPIEMPPLRERRNDIPLLANHFLEKTSGRLSRTPVSFANDTLSVLMNYSWPGNVRQLQNAIQFALIKCRSTPLLPAHLPPEVLSGSYVPVGVERTPGKAGRKPKLTDDIVRRALEKTDGNKAKAARLLGVGRATLYNFLNAEEALEVSV